MSIETISTETPTSNPEETTLQNETPAPETSENVETVETTETVEAPAPEQVIITSNDPIHPVMVSYLTDPERVARYMGNASVTPFRCMVHPGVTKCVVLERQEGKITVKVLDDVRDEDKKVVLYDHAMPIRRGPGGSDDFQVALAEVVKPKETKEEKAAKKAKGAKKEKTAKEKAAKKETPTLREKMIRRMANAMGKPIPAADDLFKHFQDKFYKRIKPTELAAFVDSQHFPDKGTEVIRVMHEMLADFGADNVLNLAAEINPLRVREVIMDLIRDGSLFEPITVVKIVGEVPEHLKDMDRMVYQIASGRHRIVSISMLVGSTTPIPCRVMELSYEEAARYCLKANDTRDLGKTEMVYHDGMMVQLETADLEAAYDRTIKEGRSVTMSATSFAAYHAVILRDSAVGTCSFKVTEKPVKGTYTISMPAWKNAMKEALTTINPLVGDRLKTFSTAKGIMLSSNLAINSVFTKLDEFAKIGSFTDPNKAWSSYGSCAIGKLIGGALVASVNDKKRFDPEVVGSAIAQAAISFLRLPSPGEDLPSGITHFNRTAPTDLTTLVRNHAKSVGIDIPNPDAAAEAAFNL